MDRFGDWRDTLSMYDSTTWPRKMREEVEAGESAEIVMHKCFVKPEHYADPVVTKFLPGQAKEFRAITKLQPSKVDSELRQFEGWATRPEIDRTDEIVESKGVRYRNPTPLLMHHDHRLPVGSVEFIPKAEGIWFRAKLPVIAEAGELRERVESAWAAVKARLITAVSVGFRSLETELRPDGVLVYTKSELFELSLVTVPALPSAQIDASTIKGMHTELETPPSNLIDKGLTEQQINDVRRAYAVRVLGKAANTPATNEMLHVAVQALRDHDRLLEQRIKALEQRA